MSTQRFRHVLCAIRGRPESRATVTQGMKLALEHDARLSFVHVINADFLGQATPTMTSVQVVYRQLLNMSQFTMDLLCDQSRRQGVENVDYILRTGSVPEQIFQVLRETGADALVIGLPVEEEGVSSVFTAGEFQQFVARVKDDLAVEVFQVMPDEEDPLNDEDILQV